MNDKLGPKNWIHSSFSIVKCITSYTSYSLSFLPLTSVLPCTMQTKNLSMIQPKPVYKQHSHEPPAAHNFCGASDHCVPFYSHKYVLDWATFCPLGRKLPSMWIHSSTPKQGVQLLLYWARKLSTISSLFSLSNPHVRWHLKPHLSQGVTKRIYPSHFPQ